MWNRSFRKMEQVRGRRYGNWCACEDSRMESSSIAFVVWQVTPGFSARSSCVRSCIAHGRGSILDHSVQKIIFSYDMSETI